MIWCVPQQAGNQPTIQTIQTSRENEIWKLRENG